MSEASRFLDSKIASKTLRIFVKKLNKRQGFEFYFQKCFGLTKTVSN